MNPDIVLCECCYLYPAYENGKCVICKDAKITEVATIGEAQSLLKLQEKWQESSENER